MIKYVSKRYGRPRLDDLVVDEWQLGVRRVRVKKEK